MATSGLRRGTQANTRGSRSTATRRALVDGAVRALRELGFAGASAREIAERANCNQALVFYHFGSVNDLLLAALDDVSDRRLAAYTQVVDQAHTLTELIDSARTIFHEDLESGDVAVLVEMITGAGSTPGLGPQVVSRLARWREFAASAVCRAVDGTPVALLFPPEELAHAIVAGFLGLEMLADLDGDQQPALALFDRARTIAALFDLTDGTVPSDPREGDQP
ncbi:MAG: TetR/AcrR family transcriptional regulator [Arachnia sp.]